MLSCQDNCINIAIFNNVLHHSCTGTSPARSCGGLLYFNGAGGGGQKVYNNTLVAAAGSCIVVTGLTSPVTIRNNIYNGCGTTTEVRPNSPMAAIANFNDGFAVDSSSWAVYNSQSSGVFLSLANYRSQTGQDINTVTGDPKLDGLYRLQVGSAAIGLGLNLTSLGIAPLNRDARGNIRPAIGAWDTGAFQSVGTLGTDTIPPTAPTNLIVR
jgi:hypothetical protein